MSKDAKGTGAEGAGETGGDEFATLMRREFADAPVWGTPDDTPDGTPDGVADGLAVTGSDSLPGSVPDTRADGLADRTQDTGPDGGSDGDPDGLLGLDVVEGRIVFTGADAAAEGAAGVGGAPERLEWAWAVGWRHKLRRFRTYWRRYLWNLTVVLGAWVLRATGWWFRGLARSSRDFVNYLDDRQALAVANQTAGGLDGRADVDSWLKTRAERHREVRDRRRVVRSRVALPVLLAGLVAVLVVWFGHSAALRASAGPSLLAATVAAGCWLVYYGRPRAAPFWPQFREPSPYPPVTNDSVTGALLATGIGQLKELVKAGHSPVDVIFRDDTAGGKIAETHPVPGVTTEMLTAKAVVVAGGLKRPPAMVHVSQAPSGVPGHVEILVLDIDPGTTKPRRFAYLSEIAKTAAKGGSFVNVGSPCTVGYDARNRAIRWVLPGTNGITTGTPGSGKTAYLLQLACLAAADVEGAQLGLFDLKGMGDYAEVEPVCYAYGADPDPTETARMLLAALHGLKREVIRRRKVLSELKRAASDLLDNNAAALTDRLARAKKYRMPWILFIIDEVHEALSDPLHGKEIAQLLMDLMKIGRACGLHIEIATQRTDADSVPTGISSLPVVRVAFHQNGQPGNDQILGTGAYKRGVDATAFRRGAAGSGADDRGSCWYIGSEGGVPVKVRTAFVLPDVKRIINAALAARTAAGTLEGAAAGIVEQIAANTQPAHSALDDVRSAFVAAEVALHNDVIYHRVNTRYPGRWKSWSALLAALKAEAPAWKAPTVDVGQVRPTDAPDAPGQERTRKGIRREHLDAAIAKRNTDHPDRAGQPGELEQSAITDGDDDADGADGAGAAPAAA